MKPKFKTYQKVHHVKTGAEYMIIHTPDPLFLLESTGSMFYVYLGQGTPANPPVSWVCDQKEMEDGRFVELGVINE